MREQSTYTFIIFYLGIQCSASKSQALTLVVLSNISPFFPHCMATNQLVCFVLQWRAVKLSKVDP